MFTLYLKLGMEHILNIDAYDHILFLVTLISSYTFDKWKEILILITSFTIGHTISLFLGTFKIINIQAEYIEFFIILTILFTALWNIFKLSVVKIKKFKFYLPSLFFGMIHGLGFSNTLQHLLFNEKEIFIALFGFNTGVEIGQLIIIPFFLIINFLIFKFINKSQVVIKFLNTIVVFVYITLLFFRLPF